MGCMSSTETNNKSSMDKFKLIPDNYRTWGQLEGVLSAYRTVTPGVQLYGETSFAPIINEAIRVAQETKEYHICLIITDGCVSEDCEKATVDAIINASNHPISIIIIGAGDGDSPDDAMVNVGER